MEGKGYHRSKSPVHILRSSIAVRTCRNRDEMMAHTSSRPSTIAASTDRTRRAEYGVLMNYPTQRVTKQH